MIVSLVGALAGAGTGETYRGVRRSSISLRFSLARRRRVLVVQLVSMPAEEDDAASGAVNPTRNTGCQPSPGFMVEEFIVSQAFRRGL
jgi:hypothetical protein